MLPEADALPVLPEADALDVTDELDRTTVSGRRQTRIHHWGEASGAGAFRGGNQGASAERRKMTALQGTSE